MLQFHALPLAIVLALWEGEFRQYSRPKVVRREWGFWLYESLSIAEQPPDQTLLVRNLRKLRKLRKLRQLRKKSQGRSAFCQGLIFLMVALCRQGIFILVSRSGSVWGFSRCLQVFSYFLKVTRSFLKVDMQTHGARFSRYRLKRVLTP